jgi:hypothetical protein
MIPGKLLRLAALNISSPIAHIVNRVITSSRFPSDWKIAKVVPIYKGKGEKQNPSNYRPISLLPVVPKIFERVIADQFLEHLHNISFLSSTQSGFRKHHSTATCLIKLTNDILLNYDQGLVTGILSLDLSKAFDTIDHSLLLTKIAETGVHSSLLTLFENYLTGRRQFVVINQQCSTTSVLSTGVPQGSILGPLLFIIYINELKKICTQGNVSQYADDTQLYCSTQSPESLNTQLKNQLITLDNWFHKNKLKLNVDKTQLLLCGSRHKLSNFNSFNITYNGNNNITPSDTVKILGVTLDRLLTWTPHVDILVKDAWKRAFLIKKCASIIPREALITLYHGLVSSKLSYCDVVWDSCGAQNASRLQKVQNFCARYITGLSRSLEANNSLRWASLQSKRRVHRLQLLHKSINGLAPRYINELFKPAETLHDRSTRFTSSSKFCLPTCKTAKAQNSFAYATSRDWNQLPESHRNITSVEGFRRAILKTLA